MQSLAFLWFQLQMKQQYLRERTFEPAESPANSANLNTPIGADTLRRASVKRKRSKVLLRIAAYLAIVAFVQQARSSQLKNSSPDAPVTPQAPVHVYPEKAGAGQIVAEETVSVIHPEKSGASTLQLPGQLSAYTDAPIYAQSMSEILLTGITTPLWTYTKFLTARPIQDTYGVIETPDNAGLVDPRDAAIVREIGEKTLNERAQASTP